MTETMTDVNISDAEFNYNIYDSNNRIMLKNAHGAITMAEGWDWIRNFQGQSFMFSKDGNANIQGYFGFSLLFGIFYYVINKVLMIVNF